MTCCPSAVTCDSLTRPGDDVEHGRLFALLEEELPLSYFVAAPGGDDGLQIVGRELGE